MAELRRRAVLQVREVFPVHHQNEVELFKVLGRNLAGAVFRNIKTAFFAGQTRTHIGLLTHVVAARGRTVRVNHIVKLRFRHLLAEDGFGRRTAADVARAHEKNINHFVRIRSLLPTSAPGQSVGLLTIDHILLHSHTSA